MAITDLAVAAEEREFESLFVPEHTHIPIPRRTSGRVVPSCHQNTGTPSIRSWRWPPPRRSRRASGSGPASPSSPNGIRSPLPKRGFTRLAIHGTAFPDRWKVTRERVLAMKRLWTDERPEFHGKFVDFDPVLSFPKPVQPAGRAVLLGVQSRYGFARIVEYGDGWMPILVPDLMEPGDGIERLRDAAARSSHCRSVATPSARPAVRHPMTSCAA